MNPDQKIAFRTLDFLQNGALLAKPENNFGLEGDPGQWEAWLGLVRDFPHLILDLSEFQAVTSRAIALLEKLCRTALVHGGEVRFWSPQPAVETLLPSKAVLPLSPHPLARESSPAAWSWARLA